MDERELEYVVGRNKEIHKYLDILDECNQEKSMIMHVFGTGGIGKTTFLRVCKHVSKQKNIPFLAIDSCDFIHTEQGLTEALIKQLPIFCTSSREDSLGELIEKINLLTVTGKLVIAIDTFEKMPELESWLRDCLFPYIRNTLLLFAGRRPLKGKWILSPVLRERILQFELGYLQLADCIRYLKKCGLNDLTLIEKLSDHTKGHPLSLSLAAAAYSPSSSAIGNDWADDVIDLWLNEVPDDELRQLLNAASILGVFQHESLSFIVEKPIPTEVFNRLISMSFVNKSQKGWQLHDLLREFICRRLKSRSPALYKRFEQRCATYYANTILHNPITEIHWEVGQLFKYTGVEVARALLPDQEHPLFYWETVNESTLEEALAYADWIKNNIEPMNETGVDPVTGKIFPISYTAQEVTYNRKSLDRLTEIFQLDPSSIKLLRDHNGKPVAIMLIIPFHAGTLEWLEQDPYSSPYLSTLSPEEKAALRTCPDSPAGWFMRSSHYSTLKNPAIRKEGVYFLYSYMYRGGVFVCSPFSSEITKKVFPEFGFQTIEGATHYHYDGKTPTYTYAIDTRGDKLRGCLEQLFKRAGLKWEDHFLGNPLSTGQARDITSNKASVTSILTQREWEVVKHVIAGRSNTEVAHLLFISENTVKKHLNSIYSKLEITKRIQLTQKILPNMLIP